MKIIIGIDDSPYSKAAKTRRRETSLGCCEV